jgi:hypothetical protein
MNSAEFFMHYMGRFMLPESACTGDAVTDALKVLSMTHALYTGASLRLSSAWAIVQPNRVLTTFKAHTSCGFDTRPSVKDSGIKRKDEIYAALTSGEPCMLLAFTKATMAPADLYISYDAREARLCSPGSVLMFDATKD